MRILGIEFQGDNLNYVVIVREDAGVTIVSGNRLPLNDTRRRADVKAFQTALTSILNDAAPARVAVKLKQESGRMRAGAAALKMEAILLANSPCDVEFVSGARIAKVTPVKNDLHKYLEPALLTALAVR